MPTIEHVLAHPAVMKAGWRLAHFLWQGSLAAAGGDPRGHLPRLAFPRWPFRIIGGPEFAADSNKEQPNA